MSKYKIVKKTSSYHMISAWSSMIPLLLLSANKEKVVIFFLPITSCMGEIKDLEEAEEFLIFFLF